MPSKSTDVVVKPKKTLAEKVKEHVGRNLSDAVLRRKADASRAKVQTDKLLERLQNHAMGKKGSEMTPTQLTAATTLLRKTLPDLVGVKAEVESSPVVFHFHMGKPGPKIIQE